jgi:adhesin transport system outer membrane protein
MAQLEKSAAQLQGSEYRLTDVVEILSLRAVESHMNILRDRERLTILENSLNEHRKIAGLVQKRARMGKEPTSSYSQAMSRVALLEAEYELAKGQLKASSAVYQELTGQEPADLQWPQELMADDWSVDKYMKSYVDSNPGVKEAKAALTAARHDSKIAKAGYLPSVDLQVSTNLMNEGDSDYDTFAAGTYEDDYQVSLSMSWGLELGGGDFDRANAAATRQQVVLNNLQDRIMGVREAIKVLNSELESARNSTRMRLNHATEAAAVVEAYTKQYKAGSQSRSLLDLLTVENEHLTSLTNALQSRYQELMLQARISRVGGQLSTILGVN